MKTHVKAFFGYLFFGLLLGLPVFGNIQYSGGPYVDATVTMDGTKQTLINDIETQLLAASWTTVSGHATTNLLMSSGTTAQSLQINLRVKDNAGTCVQLYLESTDGSLKPASYTVNNGASLIATNLLVYRVVASPFQALIYTTNATTSRQFAWVGMPFLPSFMTSTVTRAGFLFSNSLNDTDATNRCSIRNFVTVASSACAAGNFEIMTNASWWELSNTGGVTSNTSGNLGLPRFLLGGIVADLNQSISSPTGYRWRNNGVVTGDVLFAAGLTAYTDEGMVVGQIFDAIFIADSVAIDTTATFDSPSHTFRTPTNSNAGSANVDPRGGIWFAVN